MKKYSFLIVCITLLIALFAVSCKAEPEHQHNYIAKYNDVEHWKECECGSKIDIAKHMGAWEKDSVAGVLRKCSSCEWEKADPSGVAVANIDEFNAAMEDAGKTIYLINDIATPKRFSIKGKSISIDFNGHKITLSDSFADTGAGPYGLITIDNEGELTLKDSSNGNGGIDVVANSNPKIGYCIVIYPDDGHKAKLTIDGGFYKATQCAISGNGSYDNICAEIDINDGIFEGSTAIYHPQNGIMRITGGEFKGSDTAIEIRAGKVNIAGGKFISTSAVYTCKHNGSGTTTIGSAIAIAQHTTKLPITVGIDGGEFAGVNAVSVDDPEKNEDFANVKLQINGGSLRSTKADDSYAVYDYTGSMKNFIYGGTFTASHSPAEPDKQYTADGTTTTGNDGVWKVTKN